MVLSLVLYGCEIWCVTVREGVKLSALKNRVLIRMLGGKRQEVRAGC